MGGAWPERGSPLTLARTEPGRPTRDSSDQKGQRRSGSSGLSPTGGPGLPRGRTPLWRPGRQRASSGRLDGKVQGFARGNSQRRSRVAGRCNSRAPTRLGTPGCVQPRGPEIHVIPCVTPVGSWASGTDGRPRNHRSRALWRLTRARIPPLRPTVAALAHGGQRRPQGGAPASPGRGERRPRHMRG
jgi:hypothetical protein